MRPPSFLVNKACTCASTYGSEQLNQRWRPHGSDYLCFSIPTSPDFNYYPLSQQQRRPRKLVPMEPGCSILRLRCLLLIDTRQLSCGENKRGYRILTMEFSIPVPRHIVRLTFYFSFCPFIPPADIVPEQIQSQRVRHEDGWENQRTESADSSSREYERRKIRYVPIYTVHTNVPSCLRFFL